MTYGTKKIIAAGITIIIIAFSIKTMTLRKSVIESKVSDIRNVSTQKSHADVGPLIGTGPMSLGKFLGNVVYDEAKESYFLELQGARFSFKTSPIKAQDVTLEAEGKSTLEKHTSLLYGIMGPDVLHATILINPDEEDEVKPAVQDLSQYMQMVNRKKYAGVAYTKPGGRIERSVLIGSQVQSLEEDASPTTPIIQIMGPASGATETRVLVMEGGKIIVEGKSYEELYMAADFVSITLLKMLCGSSDCPDASACATGGDCGC